MVQHPIDVGPVFRALGDETRRDILRRLRTGPSTVKALASPYRMSLPALMKHLGVLEAAGLVRTGKRGRVRSCTLAPDGLRAASLWLAEYDEVAARRSAARRTRARAAAGTSLDLSRSIPAPRERVWRAWTEAEDLAGWFWPPSFAAEASVDDRVDGVWWIRSVSAATGVRGVFTEVESPHRLAFTRRWEDGDEETLVTVTLGEEAVGRTRLRIVHQRLAPGTAADHERSWSDCLDRLSAAVA